LCVFSFLFPLLITQNCWFCLFLPFDQPYSNLLKRRRPPTMHVYSPDELICHLASGFFRALPLPPSPSSSHMSTRRRLIKADDGDGNDGSQAALARFAFTPSMRKHFRSGESTVHHAIISSSAVGGGATRGCGTGLVMRPRFPHDPV
jgi:hypothetical protein